MKHKNFNKFGGTEYRFKDQISAYIFFINWIIEYQEKNSITDENAVEKAFRKYCKEEDIYEYRDSTGINRFKMVLSNLEKDLHILQFDENTKKYKLDEKFDMRNPPSSFLFFMQNAWEENNFPFKQMLKFMYENTNLNDAKKIRRAFMVYDGTESFKHLYEIDVINQIVDNEFKDIVLTDNLENNIKFRKPIKNLSLIKDIYRKKYYGLEILENDLKFIGTKDKYLNEIAFGDQRNKRINDPKIFVKNLNEIETITFLKRLRKAQLKNNLDGEYCDLFNRWMYGIGLAASSSKNEIKYLSNRINFKNGNYLVNIPVSQLDFPFTMQECIENLKKIQAEEYIDIKLSLSLNNVPNSAIAEYFVNLFFCYKLGIKPSEFKKYVNTQTDDKLKPIFTAPGGKPDMWYIRNNHMYCIETTMIKNPNQILKAEHLSCTDHLYKIINEYKLSINNNQLYFVNYKNDEEFLEKLQTLFEAGWKIKFKKGESFHKLNLMNYSFEDLTKISDI